MRRGEIVSVNFDPAQGSEANKTRPAVIVSNDAANATATKLGRGVITVVPVTSNITRIYPFQLLLPAHLTGLPRDSKAQAEQIRSVSVDRVGEFLGQLPPALVTELDRALRVQLSLLADATATSAVSSHRKRTSGIVRAGKTFRQVGYASDERRRQFVRDPLPSEHPI